MTLYIYNFADGVNNDPRVYFNGDLHQPAGGTYRLKIKSRYTNRDLDLKIGNTDYWLIELELDTYNDRYTTFNINTGSSEVASRFASGYYDYTLEWIDQDVDQDEDPDTYTWTSLTDGLLKMKTSATERLDFEGPEKEYWPNNHYEGENSDAQSYVIYKD